MIMTETNYKKEILVVFNPYVVKGKKRPFRYRAISANQLPNYIGLDKAWKQLNKFLNSGLQKDNFYVKQCGKVYLYRK